MKILLFGALRHRNFRLFYCGQAISLVGTWSQFTAINWILYSQTHSAVLLGLSTLSSQFPTFLFSLFGGSLSDRYNRRSILICTQAASFFHAVVLTVLSMAHSYSVGSVLLANFVLGCINSFDIPARHAFIYQLIPNKSDLPNAVSLNAAAVNLARLFGPTLSGIMLAKTGASVCFLLNAVSLFAVLSCIFTIQSTAAQNTIPATPGRKLRSSGLGYLRQTPKVASLMLVVCSCNFLVSPFATLLPAYSVHLSQNNSTIFCYLESAIGLGAIVGSIAVPMLARVVSEEIVVLRTMLLLAASLIALASLPSISITLILCAICGFALVVVVSTTNVIIHTMVPQLYKGRIIGYLTLGYYGLLPLGSLFFAWLSQHHGIQSSLFLHGASALGIALFFLIYRTRSTRQRT